MATVEFIQKRIEGKKKEIEKIAKKIANIEKAKATNWTKNPYWYSEADLVRENKYLNIAKQSLAEYETELAEAIDKENSRDVKIINDFLDAWEQRAVEFFRDSYVEYLEAQKQESARERAYCEWHNSLAFRVSDEERKARREEDRLARKEFSEKWRFVTQFYHGSLDWDSTMRKDIHQERNRKYDDLVNRVCSVVGTIADVSGLRIGKNGDLNGIVIGDKSSAKVETIGAGGYNVQCYHYRVLIHRV